MESPAARLLELLSALQAKPHWTATELAERLGTTTRTVRRDITRLRHLGYPVDAELGRTGGYTLGAGGALPPLLLTDDEAVAVAFGLRAAASGGVTGYDDAAVAALAKLEQVLPARLRERVLALNTAAVLVRPAGGAPVDPNLLLLLAQGCRRPERLHFGYVDGSGRESERRTEPYRLVHAEGRWYLVARDLDREAWRTFRVDRMSEPLLTGHRFQHASEPDAAAMVVEGLAFAAYDHVAEVLLHTSVDDAAREIPLTVGVLEARDDGTTLLRIAANSLDWIARYLSGLPFTFTVVDPPELRGALRQVAKRLNAAARSELGAAVDG